MIRILLTLLVVGSTTSCATLRPEIDFKDPTNPNTFATDQAECEVLAMRGVSVTEGQATGALGAGAGAVASTAIGGVTAFSFADATGGIIGGMIAGGILAEQERQVIVAWCLWHRGYTVIGHYAEVTTPYGRCIKVAFFSMDGRAPGEARDRCVEQEEEREIIWRKHYGKPLPDNSANQ